MLFDNRNRFGLTIAPICTDKVKEEARRDGEVALPQTACASVTLDAACSQPSARRPHASARSLMTLIR